MPYETEYDKLKENLREWRESSLHDRPSLKRILDAAEQTLNRMPQPVRGWVVVWPERHRDEKPALMVSRVFDTEEEANKMRLDVVRWACGDIKVVPVECDYQPRRAP